MRTGKAAPRKERRMDSAHPYRVRVFKAYGQEDGMKKIKILAINMSPRKNRNTAQLAEAVLEGCRSAENVEVETEIVNVSDAEEGDFRLCRGCWACVKSGKCVLEGDYITKIHEKIAEADGVIFASPVFFCDVTAQCKAVMDRSLGLTPIGTGKVSAAVITAGSVGISSALHTIQGFCSMQSFADAGWVATYGKTSDKEKGKEVAYRLGRKMVRMAAILKDVVENGDDDLMKDLSHHNHFAYGTHTF